MSKAFFEKHRETLVTTINKKPVKYTASSGNGTNIVVHCYYIDSKGVNIAVYAIKNKKTANVSKYIIKAMVASKTKEKCSAASVRATDLNARTMYNMMAEKYTEQIEKTRLKKAYANPAFIQKLY